MFLVIFMGKCFLVNLLFFELYCLKMILLVKLCGLSGFLKLL